MLILLLAALQTSAPPVRLPPELLELDEGWVFPLEEEQRASSVCPALGRITAGFTTSAKENHFAVSGLGRTSDLEDETVVVSILKPLLSWQSVTVGCWGVDAGLIIVNGPQKSGGLGDVRFLWDKNGPHQLSENAIYPSVPTAKLQAVLK